MAAEPQRFANLFEHPSIKGMYDLPPKEFEHFIAYVLRRAGFDVKEVGPHFLRGVDLELRLPERRAFSAESSASGLRRISWWLLRS